MGSYPKSISVSIFFITIIIVCCITAFIFLLRGCLSLYDENYLTGKIQIYNTGGKDLIICLRKFDKCTYYSREGGIIHRGIKTYYFLQSREPQTGKLIKEAKINNDKNNIVKILGGNETVWVYANNKFYIYDIINLNIIADNDKIYEINPFLKDKLPDDIQYLKSNEINKSVNIISKDGMNYSIDFDTMKASEKKDQISENNIEIAKIHQLIYSNKDYDKNRSYYEEIDKINKKNRSLEEFSRKQELINRLLEEGLDYYIIVKYAFSNDYVYSLLTDAEIANNYLNMNIFGITGVNRCKFYKAELDKSNPNSEEYNRSTGLWNILNDKNVFLNGGFLINPSNLSAIQLKNPDSFIIIHRKEVDDKSFLLLSRINLDGTKTWEIELPLNKILQLVVTEGHLILLSNDGKKITDRSKYNVYIPVNIENGKFESIRLY